MSAMDGATEPPGTDSRRPPQPDPPRHPTGSPLLLRLLLLRLPASGRHYRGGRAQPGRSPPQRPCGSGR
ncbi:hypothetical protein CEK00_02410 [Stenotrophomonas maltophilia]|uniref:Uncharacterized protein n=1 Tax=Stenotrophomonas maltophilia TaxID=40324 RepID=A0A270NPY8_STEMA|nr:hypothetical protein CEK00_02410 [Stenotrophomonas maltophilia]